MENAPQVDTLVVSDVHLGSAVSRAEALLKLLKKIRFRRLILLGDIFDDLDFNRLTRSHWELLSHIRLLSNPKRGVEVVWVVGNHDEKLAELMHCLIGVEVAEEYQWYYQGQLYFAVHGHQFDRFLSENRLLSDVATVFYALLQKLDSRNHRFSRFAKRASKKWLRVSRQIAQGAVKYASRYGAHFVFCGHTHQAVAWEIDGVQYFNSGCWTDIPSTYITIDETGVRLHEEF